MTDVTGSTPTGKSGFPTMWFKKLLLPVLNRPNTAIASSRLLNCRSTAVSKGRRSVSAKRSMTSFISETAASSMPVARASPGNVFGSLMSSGPVPQMHRRGPASKQEINRESVCLDAALILVGGLRSELAQLHDSPGKTLAFFENELTEIVVGNLGQLTAGDAAFQEGPRGLGVERTEPQAHRLVPVQAS